MTTRSALDAGKNRIAGICGLGVRRDAVKKHGRQVADLPGATVAHGPHLGCRTPHSRRFTFKRRWAAGRGPAGSGGERSNKGEPRIFKGADRRDTLQ